MHSFQHHGRRFSSGIILSIAGFAITVNSIPPLVTVLADRYAVTPGLFGVVFFFQYISFTLFSSVGGYLYGKGKGNPVTILLTALLTAGVIVGVIGIIPSFLLLVICMTAIGGLGGIVESTGTMILSDNNMTSELARKNTVTENTSGRLIYVSQLFYCLGALFAPMIIGVLLAGDIPIDLIGIALSLLTIGITIVVLRTILKDQGRGLFKSSQLFPAPGTSRSKTLRDKPTLKTFFWFLAVMFLYVMLEASISSWLPTYLETTFSISPSRAAFHLTIFWAGLAATRFLYIFIQSQAIRTQLMIQIAGIFFSALALLFTSVSPPLRSTFIFILGISCGPIWPLIINLYSQKYSRRHYIMYLVSAGSAGALAGILVTSTVVEFVGITSMMDVIFVYSLLIATGYLGLFWRTRASRFCS